MELFDSDQFLPQEVNNSLDSPLAELWRPSDIDEFVGQEHLFKKGSAVSLFLESQCYSNLIFYGPPGVGKTSLAFLLAKATEADLIYLSAVHSGKKDLEEVEKKSVLNKKNKDRLTILFLDEIHRFNKAQQDVLLRALEKGTYVLLGATTENPGFTLNKALLSRSQVIELTHLTDQHLAIIVKKGINKFENLNKVTVIIPDKILNTLVKIAKGDARSLINHLELALESSLKNEAAEITLDEEMIKNISNNIACIYDRDGDQHYQIISAFIKSIRGSDPDASIYYLARMLSGGEDPLFIARRLVILASEDIGNSDPQAAILASSIFNIVSNIGMPEARISLAQLTTYLSLAPKSNASYKAIDKAIDIVKNTGNIPVPKKIVNANTAWMKDKDYGKNYHYAHNYDGGFYPEKFLPQEVEQEVFYKPSPYGYEKVHQKRINWLNDQVNKSRSQKK